MREKGKLAKDTGVTRTIILRDRPVSSIAEYCWIFTIRGKTGGASI